LLQINYSPAVTLNCTYALYKARGKEAALKEAEKLQLNDNRFYHVLLGECIRIPAKKQKNICCSTLTRKIGK
jgi:predicted RNA polymerase sigma factor